jgi:hypothetical protein
MLRFKDFLDRDELVSQYANMLWEVSLIASMDDYIKKGLKKPFKVHPSPSSDVNKELVSQLNKILKSEGLSSEQIEEQAFQLVVHDENPSGQNKHIIKKEGLDINSQGVMGVCASTEIKGEEHKFYVYATAKGHIEHSFFELKVSKVTKGYKFSNDSKPKEITTKSLAASETTDLYEITASVALGIDNASANELSVWLTKNFILDDGNYDGDLIVEFFDYMESLTGEVNGLVYNKWNYQMANWYLETIMGIIKGALLFRDEYTGFFAKKPSEVLWNDVDRTYKYNWFRKIGKGAVNKNRTTKENTADAIIFKGGSRKWKRLYGMSDDELANLEMKASTTDGVVEIWESGRMIAEILQVSMKHSRSGAQGGKSLVALAGWGIYDKTVRGGIEDYLWTSTANESFEMLGELFNVAKIKGYLARGVSFVSSLLNKMVDKLKRLFWGIINKITSKSVMNRKLSKLNSQLNKGVLREGLGADQVKWNKVYANEKKPFLKWERWKKNTTVEFLALAKELDGEVEQNNYFVGTNGGAETQVKLITDSFENKDYNQVAMLNIPVNMIALQVMTEIANRLNDQTDGFTNALQIFNSLSFDMSMGDSEVPVIKLYGVEWSVKDPSAGGQVEYDVIKRVNVSGDVADEIKGVVDPETQPMGGFYMQPSARDSGLNYLATYMYIFYEYDGEQFTYKKMQIRPDKGGIAAESYPQSFIWDVNTKTFDKK